MFPKSSNGAKYDLGQHRPKASFRFLLLAGLLALGACSSKEPAKPESDSPKADAKVNAGSSSSSGSSGYDGRKAVAAIPVLEQAALQLDGAGGGSVSLKDGAKIQFPAGAVTGKTEVRLLRTAKPADSNGVKPLTDVYRVEAVGRPQQRGAFSLAIPLGNATDLPAEQLGVFMIIANKLYPVAAKIDSKTKLATIENPNVALANLPAETPRFLRTDSAIARTDADPWTVPTGYTVGKTPQLVPAASQLCVAGKAGEVHADPKHAFRIILEVDTPCATVQEVSRHLQDALEYYNKKYTKQDGTGALAHLTPDSRMDVYLGAYEDAGEYKPWSWRGWMQIGSKSAQNKPAELRDTMFHELFHGVQDSFFNMYLAGNQGYWWFEATAEWAGAQGRQLTFNQMVQTELVENFKYLLSVPIRDSSDKKYPGGNAAYGYALLVDFVERQHPGYLAETLRSVNSALTSTLYKSMVDAGKLQQTYPQFVAEILPLAGSSIWTRARIAVTKDEFRLFRRSSDNIGDINEQAERVSKPEVTLVDGGSAAAMKLEPLTTLFYQVRLSGSSDRHPLEISVQQRGAASDKAWIMTRQPQNQMGPQAPPVRIAASGTKIDNLGSGLDEVWIAVFNDDPEQAVDYQVTLKLQRKKASNFEFVNVNHSDVQNEKGETVRTLLGEIRNKGQAGVNNPIIVLQDSTLPKGTQPPRANLHNNPKLPAGGTAPFSMTFPPGTATSYEFEVDNIHHDTQPRPTAPLELSDAYLGLTWPAPGEKGRVRVEIEARLKNISNEPTNDEDETLVATFYDAAGKVVGVGYSSARSPNRSIPPGELGGYLKIDTILIADYFTSYRITGTAGSKHSLDIRRNTGKVSVNLKDISDMNIVEAGAPIQLEIRNDGEVPVWPCWNGMARIGAQNQADGSLVKPGDARRFSDPFRKKRKAAAMCWLKLE